MAAQGLPNLWVEVEDTLRHFDAGAQATGIPRVVLAIARAWDAVHRERVRLFRITCRPGLFESLPYEELIAHCSASTVLDVLGRLGRGGRLARHGGLYVKRALSRAVGDVANGLGGSRCRPEFKPGDWVLVSGASWQNRHYAAQLKCLAARFSIRIAVLIHDIIPFDFPEFCTPHARGQFEPWFDAVVAQSDLIITSSAYNQNALTGLRRGYQLPPVRRVEFGVSRATAAVHPLFDLPERFALTVGTIEIRKNHIALVRAWRSLIERYGAERVPSLVFAGRMGWLVDPLQRALQESHFLDGKIVLLHDLTDEQLAQAYERCAFTLLPSFCEGWGLPVAESLSHGKPCIASDRTAIPEVGGEFADYIDPDDDSTIVRAVERLLFDAHYTAEKTASIRSRYTPPEWRDCARQIVATIDAFDATKKPVVRGCWPNGPLGKQRPHPDQETAN